MDIRSLGFIFFRFMLVCFAVLSAIGCHSTQSFLWPKETDPYNQITGQWTRENTIYKGVMVRASVTAVLKSKKWREAFVEKSAAVYGLSITEKSTLAAEQEKAHEKWTEIIVAVESPEYGNDELTGKYGDWSVYLGKGEEKVYPLELRQMKKNWANEKLAIFFPHRTRWQKFYHLRFARQNPGAINFYIAGPVGRFSLVWQDFE